MKNPSTLINLDGESYLVYPDSVTNINGMPVVKEKWVKFICSNCRDYADSKMNVICDQHQINSGKKVTGTAMACEKFVLRKR